MNRFMFISGIWLLSFVIFFGGKPHNVQAQNPIPDGAEVEQVASGFQFTEGPFWDSNGELLFSDIPANTIFKWTPGGDTEVYIKPSGHSNGIDSDAEGRLILAQHDRKISRVEDDGKMTVLADSYNGKKLNSPNDLVVSSDGSIYFTDPPFAIDEDQKELDFNGVYRIAPDGSLHLLVDNFDLPNGIDLSPDESILFVNDSGRNHVRAFDLSDDGTVSNGHVFAEMKDPKAKGSADGMKVDAEGNVYTTGPGGIWIFDSDGDLLDRISVPQQPSNLAWGGDDMKTLYITARTGLYRIRTNVGGE